MYGKVMEYSCCCHHGTIQVQSSTVKICIMFHSLYSIRSSSTFLRYDSGHPQSVGSGGQAGGDFIVVGDHNVAQTSPVCQISPIITLLKGEKLGLRCLEKVYAMEFNPMASFTT
ncbi:hypothetical protein [Anaerocolumna aminovalerica]|uniref:hypothetical protein n=2 Tax=Anaerocolumna aminovalerica TaxID=1527 RepID=UPI00248B4C33|nr:hypothetical protein [Anaerocolumna aminovalerica]